MSTTEQRRNANRANAQLSTGPATVEGKAQSSRNATRHGLLSRRLVLDDEDPSEFDILAQELSQSLRPFGAAEAALVEQIAITIWRQQRLVRAETAAISLAREPVPLARALSDELRTGYSNEIKPEHLQPFDADREAWCRSAMAEIEALEEIDLRSIESQAPTVYGQLLSDAEGDTPEKFLAGHPGGLTAFVGELMQWCAKVLREAEARPRLLALTEQLRTKAVVLPAGTLEIFSRYQTTLDHQLYKALKALRETQEWRMKTLEASAGTAPSDAPVIIDAA